MTTKEMCERLDEEAGDLVELSMMRLSDNSYAGVEPHPAYRKINMAAELLAQSVYDLIATATETSA
jgi:hypothetical protein